MTSRAILDMPSTRQLTRAKRAVQTALAGVSRLDLDSVIVHVKRDMSAPEQALQERTLAIRVRRIVHLDVIHKAEDAATPPVQLVTL